jgi:hypothetical protein
LSTDTNSSRQAKKRELRKFGITVGIGFAVFAALGFWRGKGFYPYFAAASAVFLCFGLAAPMPLRPVHRVWMAVAQAMGWFMTRVILTVLFYAGFTPIGGLGRLFGKRFMEMGVDPSKDSYWDYRERTAPDPERYEKQY